jgi:hypothetical protein
MCLAMVLEMMARASEKETGVLVEARGYRA